MLYNLLQYKINIIISIHQIILVKNIENFSRILKLIFKYCCNYPYRLETILHRKFSHKQVHNEWYKIPLRFIMKYSLSLDEVHNFEKTCQEVDNIIEVMKDNIFFAKNLR